MDREPILICYDGSDAAERAIHAASVALSGRKAFVVDIGPVLTGSESLAATSQDINGSALEKLNKQAALERATAGAKVAQQAGFEAEPHAALYEPAWEGILNAADELGAALIVIGSHRRKGPAEIFDGSVSHKVVTHAKCPVLVVPPPE